MSKRLTKEQAEAIRRKQDVLNNGLYTPIPHRLYREILPQMQAKYGKADARDALFIYGYLHAFVNGESDKDVYLWTYLSVDQIVERTGIDRSRIKPLCDILENEGLLITEVKRTATGRKKYYMPLL